MKISPITAVEIQITELSQQDNDILDFFDYSKAAQEFFNLFKGETCYSFVEELIKVLQNDIDKYNKSLEKINVKFIKFKSKEDLIREQLTRNIIENTKSF